jgi:hypothetical protein
MPWAFSCSVVWTVTGEGVAVSVRRSSEPVTTTASTSLSWARLKARGGRVAAVWAFAAKPASVATPHDHRRREQPSAYHLNFMSGPSGRTCL